jgi:hypothetical protein
MVILASKIIDIRYVPRELREVANKFEILAVEYKGSVRLKIEYEAINVRVVLPREGEER